MTRTATSSPTAVGAPTMRQDDGCGNGPMSAMRLQSIATRKHTTASPEKIPMKTERIRKKRSSAKLVSKVTRASRCASASAARTCRDVGLSCVEGMAGVSLTDRQPHDPEKGAAAQDRFHRADRIAEHFVVRSA